jgi:hypothetical protein
MSDIITELIPKAHNIQIERLCDDVNRRIDYAAQEYVGRKLGVRYPVNIGPLDGIPARDEAMKGCCNHPWSRHWHTATHVCRLFRVGHHMQEVKKRAQALEALIILAGFTDGHTQPEPYMMPSYFYTP